MHGNLTGIGGIAALSALLVPGMAQAQTPPPAPVYTYDVVSIHPSAPGQTNSRIGPGPQGGLRAQNTPVMALLTFAYDVRGFQFVDVPSWVWNDHFDVSFTPDKSEKLPEPGTARSDMDAFFGRTRQRLQAVLRDRFGVVLRAETRTMPVYALTISKSGYKLTAGDVAVFPSVNANERQATAKSASMKMLADLLSSELDRPVVNETGLDGIYDFKLEWTPEIDPAPPAANDGPAAAGGGPSIFTALSEQLGLRLESKRAPARVYVIEKIEKPSEN
ncbi:MAG TPA: TIGR03435 family protein [Bryobacteraceae bacterium]|nr:TIGR03435 family protein [Bryobacteraceae bacterium]